MLHLDELAKLAKKVQKAEETEEILSFGTCCEGPSVHISSEVFLDKFKDYTVKSIKVKAIEYFYCEFDYDGVRFFCMPDKDPREVNDESASEVQTDEPSETEGTCS